LPLAGASGTFADTMRRRSLLLAVLALALASSAGEASGAATAAKRASPARLKAFSSCTTLVRYARRNGLRQVRDQAARFARPAPVPLTGGGGPTPPGAGEDGGSGGPLPLQSEGGSPTNVQEAGVDEPDIVKAKGAIVLALVQNVLHAVDTSASPPRLLGSRQVRGYGGELLVHGDRALVITQSGFGGGGVVPPPGPIAIDGRVAQAAPVPLEWNDRSVLTEIDLSDLATLRVVRTLDVEGRYVSSRLTGRTARVVVSTSPRALDPPVVGGAFGAEDVQRWERSVERARSTRWRPSSVLRVRRTGRRVQRPLVGCRRVRRAAFFSGLDMISVLTIDLEKGLPAVDTDTVLSTGETVYASPRNLYVATERWLGVDPTVQEVEQLSHTAVHQFDASEPGVTTYRASGEVPGYVLNQWALSEHDGVLRAATTDRPAWWGGPEGRPSESAVRTYASRGGRLVQLGAVAGLGKGERIYAVRFIGDIGFVVTFRQTDPLYALDLSKPADPRLVGELKVPGYSAYLHPLGDDLLLGVGRAATDQGTLRGVQVSLFDISDLRNPARLDVATIGGSFTSTEIEQDHHAFLWWQPERLAVVPFTDYGDDLGRGPAFGAYGFRVDRANGIRRVATWAHPGGGDFGLGIRRALVLGNRLVTVSPAGVMTSPLGALEDARFTAFPPPPVPSG
jgi:hypothetical protein